MLTNDISNALVRIDQAEVSGDRARLSTDQAATLARAQLLLAAGDHTALGAVASVLDRTVRMPAYRLSDAERVVARLARTAAERGLPVPQLTVVSTEVVGEGAAAEHWTTVRLLGAAPVLSGWRLVAAVSTTTGATDPSATDAAPSPIVSLFVASGETLVRGADYYLAHSDACEHCNRRQRRCVAYVLRHTDAREVIVGSSCVNDYLGTEALSAWIVFSRLQQLVLDINSWDYHFAGAHYEWLAEQAARVRAARVRQEARRDVSIPLRDFVACCVAEIDRGAGYVRASDDRFAATGATVFRTYQDATHLSPTEDDHAAAKEICEWAQAEVVGTDERDAYGEPTYLTSLARALEHAAESGVCRFHANMIASVVGAYRRALARRAEAETFIPGYAAPHDTRCVLTLTVLRRVGGAWTCRDAEGHAVRVRGESCKAGRTISPGDTLVVSGTAVCSVYRGVDQTFISRPSIHRPGEETPALRKNMRTYCAERGLDVPAWAQSARRGR